MSDPVGELEAALDASDGSAVRQSARDHSGDEDAVLATLARHAAAGSPLATEVLLERLDESGVINRMVRAALLDEAAVDDVCQDVLISVASSIGAFRGEAKVTTWLHTIVRSRVVDHLRRQRATAPLPDDDLSPSQRMSSILATKATVQQALATLPDLYREPVVLRDLEGMEYAAIAERLGRPVGTVKAQISRGRALVAAAIRGDGATGETM